MSAVATSAVWQRQNEEQLVGGALAAPGSDWRSYVFRLAMGQDHFKQTSETTMT